MQVHLFLIRVPDVGDFSNSRPGRFTSAYSVGGWLSPRACLNVLKQRKISLPGQESGRAVANLQRSHCTDEAFPTPEGTST